MRRDALAAAILLVLAWPVAAGHGQESREPIAQTPPVEAVSSPGSPGASADADGPEEPLEVDLDTAIAGVLTRMLATPRFEEEIEVRDRYQEALDAHLQAAALRCRPPSSGPPPSHTELEQYGANPKPPSADLLTPTKMLFGKVKDLFSGKEPRFFLYSVRREDAPERVVYVVLDDRVSASARFSVPGTRWEPLGEYSDRDEAEEALERVQRGKSASPAAGEEAPRALWAATGCE